MTDPVEILARRYCAQENEIWEEAGAANRKRWRDEAQATILAVVFGAAVEGRTDD